VVTQWRLTRANGSKRCSTGGIFTSKVPRANPPDPLHFRDQKKYPDAHEGAQKQTGEAEAMLVRHR